MGGVPVIFLDGKARASFAFPANREVSRIARCIGQVSIAPLQWTLRSPLRPDEVDSLKAAYNSHMEWLEDQYTELSAFEIEGSSSRMALADVDGRV
jgi:hypothetical protein